MTLHEKEPVLLRAARMLKAGEPFSREEDEQAWYVVMSLGRSSTPLAVAYVNACEQIKQLQEDHANLQQDRDDLYGRVERKSVLISDLVVALANALILAKSQDRPEKVQKEQGDKQ